MEKKSKDIFRKYLPVFITAVIGTVGGYLYYRLIGCASGTCAITSNPIISTLYGGIIGALLGFALSPGACRVCGRKKEK